MLWNGEATESFKSTRGIRQGDPISPYLFTICMEKLHHLIQDAINEGEWSPIKLTAMSPPISHLFFADDLVIFGEASTFQVDVMLRCLDTFCQATGQRMNKDKTRIYFSKNVHFTRAVEMSQRMGVKLTGDLGKYLGIPLLHKKLTLATCAPLLSKTQKRLSGWKSKMLNISGRTTLIKSVLSSIPSYHMQTMLIPKGIIKKIEQQSRGFLWGDETDMKKLHLISWDQITREKRDGGLGIKDLRK